MVAINDSVGAKVKAVMDRWEAAWNTSDMKAMWQLATDDVHWVNVVGMHWRGKAEVQKAHQAYFDLLFKDRSCKLDEIESIEPLPGGAFVAVVRWSMGGFRRPTGVVRAKIHRSTTSTAASTLEFSMHASPVGLEVTPMALLRAHGGKQFALELAVGHLGRQRPPQARPPLSA